MSVTTTTSLAVAARAYDVGALAWGSFASFALWFTLAFARPRWLRRPPVIVALIVPAVVAVGAQWAGGLAASYPARPWGHAFAWQSSPWTVGFYLYYGAYMLTAMALLLDTWRRAPTAIRRRQAKIIALWATAPLLLASATDVWLPLALSLIHI